MEGQILGIWSLGRKLGEGEFGVVYETNSEKYPGKWVIKIAPLKKKTAADSIYYEYIIYTTNLMQLKYTHIPAQPPKNFYGEDKKYRFLVIEKLDYTLKDYIKLYPKNISVLLISYLIKSLEDLHKIGYVFVDIKPDNFMIKNNVDDVYLIDVAMVRPYKSSANEKGVGVNGTQLYTSIAVDSRFLQFPRDDIEATMYMLLSFFVELPWKNSRSEIQLKQIKKDLDILTFTAENQIPEIGIIIKKCQNLQAKELPDYKNIMELLMILYGRL
jgi:serine/threonine protein kinase